MTNKKQPCNRRTCPMYRCANESIETQTSWHTCLSGSEAFNEAANADDLPDDAEELSSHQMTLLQKIRDPQQFLVALRDIVGLAESLLAAIEDAIKEGASKFGRSISSIINPKSSVETPPARGQEARGIYCDDRDVQIEITVQEVTVPLTLHIRPKVPMEWILSESMDEEPGEPIEPIRTASISISPGPRLMHFADDSINEAVEKEPEGTVLVTPRELPLPQQKDLILCTPCNCESCPVYDASHAVVCPQNCGCCGCPWRGNMDVDFCHRKVKICSCTQNTPSPVKRCECLPNFDICPCRDIAESRHVELYGTDMYADVQIKDRYGATQNDRYRDHSNLSNQPNNEASAGLRRQQPAGPKQNQQAKDEEKNERSSTDQYYTPRGSYLSSIEQTGECCDESSNPTLMPAETSSESNKPLVRNGSALICFSTKFNDSKRSSQQNANGTQKYSFSEEYWAPKHSLQQHKAEMQVVSERMIENDQPDGLTFDNRCDGNCLQRSEQQKREKLDNCIQSLYGLHFIKKSPSFICIASSDRINSSSLGLGETVESNQQEAIQTNSSVEPIFYTPRDSSANTFSVQQPRPSSDINPPHGSIAAEITPRESRDDRQLQVLEKIYELLQCLREDHKQRIDLPIRRFETEVSLNDLPPPPPPSSPSIGQQIQVSSAPPFNIFISAMQQAEDYDVLQQSAWLDPPQNIDDNQNMELLEPPERDVDLKDDQSMARTQRLIPVDIDLLEIYYDFALETGKKLEDVQGICKEIPVKSEDFTSVEVASSLEQVKHPTAQFLTGESSSCPSEELYSSTVACCQRQDNPTNSKQALSQLDMVSEESVKHLSQELARMEEELCDCVCEDPQQCADTCCRFPNTYHSTSTENPSAHQNPTDVSASGQISHVDNCSELPEPGISQEVQVNADSLQSVIAQFPIEEENTNAIPPKCNFGTDKPDFDGEDPRSSSPSHQALAKPQKPDASDFIDSILCDLKAMKEIRENARRRPIKTGSHNGCQGHPTNLSFPVTIETVQELGQNSLFIKWKVHNCANIAGYEIFLDDRLTNRYFNRVHRAAVICNVNLQFPHTIILRAQSQLHTKPSPLACNTKLLTFATTETRTNAAACVPQPDGSISYPSVFHFEPNLYTAPANTSFDDCCAAKC